MRAAFIILSSIFTIAATIPYMIDVIRGSAKPRLASWFTWTAIQAIGAFAAFNNHQIPAAIYTLFCSLECGAIVVLGAKHGDRTFERLDYFCFMGTLIGLVALVFLKSPSLAVLVSITTDFLGGVLTIKHAWFKPQEETYITYVLFGIGSALTLLIANFKVTTAIAYPLYLLTFDLIVTVLILASPYRKLSEVTQTITETN